MALALQVGSTAGRRDRKVAHSRWAGRTAKAAKPEGWVTKHPDDEPQRHGTKMKKSAVWLPSVALFCTLFLLAGSAAQKDNPQPPPSPKTLAFINGKWFDGATFKPAHFYSVDGKLTSTKPRQVDEVIDLKDGYVVPPFGDAHNHYIAGPHDIRKIPAFIAILSRSRA